MTNVTISRSTFSGFLSRPILALRPAVETVTYDHRQIHDNVGGNTFSLVEVTFQACSNDFLQDDPLHYGAAINNSGGAAYIISSGNVSIDQCNFLYCHAGKDGGALFINSVSTFVTFTYFQNCDTGFIFDSSLFDESRGGAIYCSTVSFTLIGSNFSSCHIEYDTNFTTDGGAIHCETVTFYAIFNQFDRCGAFNEFCDYGGAIFVNYSYAATPGNCFMELNNFTDTHATLGGSVLALVGNVQTVSFNYSRIASASSASLIYVNSSFINASITFGMLIVSVTQDVFFFEGTNTNYMHSPALGQFDVYVPLYYNISSNSIPSLEPIFQVNVLNIDNQPSNPYMFPLNMSMLYMMYPTNTDVVPTTVPPTITPSAIVPTQTPAATTIPPLTATPLPTASIDPNAVPATTSSSGGLSTIAIIFIVIGVIVLVALIIMFGFICYRNGRCGTRNSLNTYDQYAQPDQIKKFTYF